MIQNSLKIPSLLSLSALPTPLIVLYGEKKHIEPRSIVKKILKETLKKIYNLESLEESWVYHSGDTLKSSADFLRICRDLDFIKGMTFNYFEDVGKIKALSKFKYSIELEKISVNNVIILDYFGAKPTKDLSLLTYKGQKPLFIDCSSPQIFSVEHKACFNAISHTFYEQFIDKSLQEYLVKKYELSFNKFLQDLFFLDLSLNGLKGKQLKEDHFQEHLEEKRVLDMKHFLRQVASRNIYRSLEYIDFSYSGKNDPTYYLITSLSGLLEKLLFIKKNITMNPYDMGKRLWLRVSEIDYYKKCISSWEDNKLKQGFILLGRLEQNYQEENYNTSLGRVLFDQLLMQLLG